MLIFCTYVTRSPGLFWWGKSWFTKVILPGTLLSVIMISLIKLYSLFRLSTCSEKYKYENKRSTLLIFCISDGVLGCFAVLEMIFVMYQKDTYWKCIIRGTKQVGKVIFTFLGSLNAQTNTNVSIKGFYCVSTVLVCTTSKFYTLYWNVYTDTGDFFLLFFQNNYSIFELLYVSSPSYNFYLYKYK